MYTVYQVSQNANILYIYIFKGSSNNGNEISCQEQKTKYTTTVVLVFVL
jgi:hypothetical protein